MEPWCWASGPNSNMPKTSSGPGFFKAWSEEVPWSSAGFSGGPLNGDSGIGTPCWLPTTHHWTLSWRRFPLPGVWLEATPASPACQRWGNGKSPRTSTQIVVGSTLASESYNGNWIIPQSTCHMHLTWKLPNPSTLFPRTIKFRIGLKSIIWSQCFAPCKTSANPKKRQCNFVCVKSVIPKWGPSSLPRKSPVPFHLRLPLESS